MSYICSIVKTNLYETNQTDRSSGHFVRLAIIHPTRLGAGPVKINIEIQLKRAISLCYTSVASLESIS